MISITTGTERTGDLETDLANVVHDLDAIIWEHWTTSERMDQCSEEANPIRDLFEDEDNAYEMLLEELYVRAERIAASRRAQTNFDNGTAHVAARKFRRRIIGWPRQTPPCPSRSKTLAIIIRLGQDFLLRVWAHFLAHMGLSSSINIDSTFDDAHLMEYTIADLEKVLGTRADAVSFDQHRHSFFPVDLNSHFNEVSEQLKGLLNQTSDDAAVETLVRCQRLSLEGRELSEEQKDRWHPDLAPERVIRDHSALVKSLFVEAVKADYSTQRIADAQTKRQILGQAKTRAEQLYQAILPRRAKILSILVFSNVKAVSHMWKRFEQLCIDDPRSESTIHDLMLPLAMPDIEKHLGADDLFHYTQYRFCAPTLKLERQVGWAEGEPCLPLRMRQAIGRGSFGDVFRVIVRAGHFYGDDRELAMKVMRRTPDSDGEWGSAEWLFQQPITHDGIMKAVASLQTPTQIYIFFPLATCSLRQFMSGPLNDGTIYHPQSSRERQEALLYFMNIAEALKYLHCGMQENSRRAKMVLIHEDLKQDNILVIIVPDGPRKIRMQITDFGISSVKRFQQSSKKWETVNRNAMFHNRLSLRDIPTAPGIGNHCVNFPPEALGGGAVDASIDVYAFGAVLSEGLAWIAGGPQKLREFERCRFDSNGNDSSHEKVNDLTSSADSPRVRLKESIRAWFETLIRDTSDAEDRSLFKSCWDLVQYGLLACDPKDRPRIEDVCEILGCIYRKERIDVRRFLTQVQGRRGDRPVPMAGSVLEEAEDNGIEQLSQVVTMPRTGSPMAGLELSRSQDSSPLTQDSSRPSSDSRDLSLVDRRTSNTGVPDPKRGLLGMMKRRRRRDTSSPSQTSGWIRGFAEEQRADSTRPGRSQTTQSQPGAQTGLEKIHQCILEGEFSPAKNLIDSCNLTAEQIIAEYEGKSLLALALDRKNDAVVAAVINKAVTLELNLNHHYPDLLHTLAEHKLIESMEAQLKGNDVRLDAKNRIAKKTALQVAYDQRDGAMMAMLLKSGASTECLGGKNVLHRAAWCTEPDAVDYILRNTTEDVRKVVNELGDEGRTPLQVSAKVGTVKCARALLSYGADPKLLDQHGNTALRYATEQPNNQRMVELLLAALTEDAAPAKPKLGSLGAYRRDYNL